MPEDLDNIIFYFLSWPLCSMKHVTVGSNTEFYLLSALGLLVFSRGWGEKMEMMQKKQQHIIHNSQITAISAIFYHLQCL